MASPLPTRKQSVNLASEVRVSRIRRDPPPKAPEKITIPADERDQWDVTIGVLVFTLAIVVIALAACYYWGWTPKQYTVQM